MYNLKIVHWNSDGITRKINELRAFSSKYKIDILLLSETHLKPGIKLHIPNYHTYRSDLQPIRGSHAHGGTAVLVHRRITHNPIKLNTSIQSTSILIKSNNSEILISAVYKPPNAELDPIDLETLTQSADWVIAAGDFNSKHPLWNSRTTNTAGNILYSHVQQSDYAVMAPTTPTYYPYTQRYRPDVLDIALVKLPMSVQITNMCELSSDHNPILLEVHSSPISSSPPPTKKFINWKKFTSILTDSKYEINPKTNNKSEIDSAINSLTINIQSAIESSSYSQNKQKSYKSIPDEILQEINEKNILRREWQRSRDPAVKRRLNAKTSFIRAILVTHLQDEWDKFIFSTSLSDTSIYNLNKKLLNKRPASHPLEGANGLAFSPIEKSELLADSLENQFTPNPGPDLPNVNNSVLTVRNSSILKPTNHVTPGTIRYLLSKLPKKKAPGEDSISNMALRSLPDRTVLALTKIYNSCLRYNYFPLPWKKASVIAIPKPGKDPTKPVSYRPIALLSSLSKVFERIILQDLHTHLINKIRPEQFAFRCGHSTTLQLVNLVDKISSNLNNKTHTAAIFLDVEKAFDRVWHEGLIHKMLIIGVPVNLLQLIDSFLTHRSFSVRIDGHSSSPRPVSAGVPQGSCLAPILYLIYTNDIPIQANSNISLFADDTLFYSANRNPTRAVLQLQRQIILATDWFNKWRLRVNTTKTIAILFSTIRSSNLRLLTINNKSIPWSTRVKYLGVTLDHHLTFGDHVNNIVKKATRVRGILTPVINRNSPIPSSTRLKLLKLYVNPILTYAGAAWAPYISRTNWRKIEAAQSTGIRNITGLPKFVRNVIVLKSTNSSTLESTIRAQSRAMFFRNSLSRHAHIRELGHSPPDRRYPRVKFKPKPLAWASPNP
jgi:hypothetical protein